MAAAGPQIIFYIYILLFRSLLLYVSNTMHVPTFFIKEAYNDGDADQLLHWQWLTNKHAAIPARGNPWHAAWRRMQLLFSKHDTTTPFRRHLIFIDQPCSLQYQSGSWVDQGLQVSPNWTCIYPATPTGLVVQFIGQHCHWRCQKVLENLSAITTTIPEIKQVLQDVEYHHQWTGVVQAIGIASKSTESLRSQCKCRGVCQLKIGSSSTVRQ